MNAFISPLCLSFFSSVVFIPTYYQQNFSGLHSDIWLPRCVSPWRTLYTHCFHPVNSPDKDSYAHLGPCGLGEIKPTGERGREDRSEVKPTEHGVRLNEREKMKNGHEGRVKMIEREQFRKWKHVDKRSEQTRWRW